MSMVGEEEEAMKDKNGKGGETTGKTTAFYCQFVSFVVHFLSFFCLLSGHFYTVPLFLCGGKLSLLGF